jgi:flagellar biosynthesis/type III secretory pathway chaperone
MPSDFQASHLQLLGDAMKTERRLLDSLVGILESQRSAVAGDDLAVLDDSVFAVQRVLLTLGEARRRRRTLLGLVSGEEELPLGELEDAMGGTLSPDLRTARDELRSAARRLAHEINRNREILRGAIRAGDQLIRTLCGAPTEPTLYGGRGDSAPSGGSLLIDTQA